MTFINIIVANSSLHCCRSPRRLWDGIAPFLLGHSLPPNIYRRTGLSALPQLGGASH